MPQSSTLMRGAAWAAFTTAAQLALQLTLMVVLARVLTPADFGVLSACLVVIGLVQTVSITGLGPLLVQRPVLSDPEIRTAHTLAMLIGATAAVAVYVSGHAIAAAFRIAEVGGSLRLLAAAFLVQGLTLVAEHLMQRSMQFRRLALFELCGYAANACASVLLALNGAGYWALAVGYFVQVAVKGVLVGWTQRHPRGVMLGRQAGELTSKGFGFSLARILNFIGSNADNFIVGRAMGADALGAYGRAYQLMSFPAQAYAAIADRALFPYMARLQDSQEALKRAHLVALKTSASIALPLSVFLCIAAQQIVFVMLGEQWRAAVAPFTALAVVMYLRLSQKISATVLRAAGAAYRHAALQGVYAVLVVCAAAGGARFGLTWVAAGVAGAISIHAVLLATASARVSGAAARELLCAHRVGVAHALLTLATLWPLARALQGTLSPGGLLAILAATGALVALCAARAAPDIFVDEAWPYIGAWSRRSQKAGRASTNAMLSPAQTASAKHAHIE
jgi:PST family polysaccharide transporter